MQEISSSLLPRESEDVDLPNKFMALETETNNARAVKGFERSKRGLRALSLRVRDLVFDK